MLNSACERMRCFCKGRILFSIGSGRSSTVSVPAITNPPTVFTCGILYCLIVRGSLFFIFDTLPIISLQSVSIFTQMTLSSTCPSSIISSAISYSSSVSQIGLSISVIIIIIMNWLPICFGGDSSLWNCRVAAFEMSGSTWITTSLLSQLSPSKPLLNWISHR